MDTIIKEHISLLIILIPLFVLSQESKVTSTGRVLDQKTFLPVPFASIYMQSDYIGTTTNAEGDFAFHLPYGKAKDSVIIRAIGYALLFKRADNFIKSGTIYLTPEDIELDEIVINSTRNINHSAKEIVRKAYAEIKNNYPKDPYILEGFIRDLQKEDGNYVEYLECAAQFLFQGYHIKKDPAIQLQEVKSNYLAKKHPWNKANERKNSIMDLVEDDFIRFDYGPIKGKNGWKYKLVDIVTNAGGMVYKIHAVNKPFEQSTLFVDTETLAFVRIELTRSSLRDKTWSRPLSNGALQVYYNLVIDYQNYNGKMYLKYKKEEDHWQIYDSLESNELLFTKYPKKELFINKIRVENLETYSFEDSMEIDESIEAQAKAYNAEFWNSYNIPVLTEKQSAIIDDLKRRERGNLLKTSKN